MRKISFFPLFSALCWASCCFGSYAKQSENMNPKLADTAQAPSFEQGYEVQKEDMAQGYSYPGRIDVRGEWDFTVSASFLLWQQILDGLDFIYQSSFLTHAQDKVEWNNKYKPAFKVMVGMFFQKHDDWQLFADYTRYYAHNKVSANPRGFSGDTLIINTWASGDTAAFSQITQAEGHLHSGLDLLDLSLGRYYYLGSHLILNTFFGARANWIFNNVDTSFTTGVDDIFVKIPSQYKTKSWAVGPRFGLDAKFLLGEGCRFFGKAAGSLLYRQNKLVGKTYTLSGVDVVLLRTLHEKDKILRPEIELGLGFAWGTYLNNRKWNFDIAASYDFYMIWNEQTITGTAFEASQSALMPFDEFLHGLTLTATLDF